MLWLELLAGFVLLLAGGEVLVRGAVELARGLGVTPLLVGLVVVGFGTSTPELVTSVEAALAGSPGIAVGNVVGSNISNLLLILGLTVLIRPFRCDGTALRRDGASLAIATALLLALVLAGFVGRIEGALLVAALVGYVLVSYRGERRRIAKAPGPDDGEVATPRFGMPVALLLTLAGIALVIVGGSFLVGGAIDLAARFGISETIIGLTIVAVGTSLPELATCVIGALRGQAELAFGNVIGSNIYNTLAIVGTTALVEPLQVPPEIARFDIWVMAAVTVLALLFARSGHRLARWEGALLTLCYLAYATSLFALA